MEAQEVSFENLDIDFDDFINILLALEIPHDTGTLYDSNENKCGRWIDIQACALTEHFENK